MGGNKKNLFLVIEKFKKTLKTNKRIYLPIYIFFLLGLVFYQGRTNGSINKISQEEITSSTNIQTKDTSECEQIPYDNNSNYTVSDQVMRFEELESFDQISIGNRAPFVIPTNMNTVNNYNGVSFSPDLNKMVFIKSHDQNNKVDQVIIEDLDSGKQEIIYSLEIGDYQGEYLKKIRGVRFSNDSRKIAITTGESMHTYDIQSNEVKEIFQDNNDYSGKYFGVFSYTIPFGWPHGNRIFLQEGYYEGRGASLFSLDTAERNNLDYKVYGMGESVLGIYDNKLVVSKIMQNEQEDMYYDLQSEIYLTDMETYEEEYLFTVSGSVFQAKVTNDEKIYFVSSKHGSEGRYPCTQIINAAILNKYDFETNELEELLITETNSQNKTKYRDLKLSDFMIGSGEYRNEFLLDITFDNNSYKYLMFESNPTELIEVTMPEYRPEIRFLINELDSEKLFSLANDERISNGISKLKKDEKACEISEKLVAFINSKKRVPEKEDYSNIFDNNPFSMMNAMTGYYLESEEDAIVQFKANLKEKQAQAFEGGEFVWGCVVTKDNATAFTYAY